MTGFTHELIKYDQFISSKYSKLRIDSQRICSNGICSNAENFEDILQDSILKTRDRIKSSGFTGGNYHGFIWRSLSNQFKTQSKRKKSFVDIEEISVQNDIQDALEDQSHNSQGFYNNLEVLVRYLFKYIALYYSEKQTLLFKTYYLTSDNTYNKLVECTGLTFKYVKDTISSMNKDIRVNLINYVKYELTTEVWRPVRHFENLYEVSNKKRVRNIHGTIIQPKYGDVYCLWNDKVRKFKSMDNQLIKVFRCEDIVIYERKELCQKKKSKR